MARRWTLALGLSVLAHVGLVVAVLGLGARPWHGTIDVEITGLDTQQVTDLPLGGPPPGGGGPARTPRRAHHRAPRAETQAELTGPKPDDREQSGQARAQEETGGPAPTDDLTAYGPRGSRLTVLVRLDRLRTSDLAPGVDALMARLPDHRDLLEGTGLDLFKSFDALLIATPHPLDPTVTFLAVRHHLDDDKLRGALNDGARATGRTMAWSHERGRWIGERRASRKSDAPPSRDDRLIVLPAPGLVVVTPPAYRALLLQRTPRDDRTPATADGGSDPDGGAAAPAPMDWTALLSRIDAEEGLMPPDGDVMMSAADIFKSRDGRAPEVYGMEVPAAARAVAGLQDDGEGFLDLNADFAEESQARHWESEWPTIRARLRGNPLVILGGFSSLLGRLTLERDGRGVHIHLTVTHEELLRLMGVAVRLLGG
jgi:hypothetical protein